MKNFLKGFFAWFISTLGMGMIVFNCYWAIHTINKYEFMFNAICIISVSVMLIKTFFVIGKFLKF